MRYFLIILLFINSALSAQNLVPNPGFETMLGMPTAQDQLNLAQPWQGLNATPDLFVRNQVSLPVNPCDLVNIPQNTAGYCDERTGQNGYAGIQFEFTTNYREYLSIPLNVPLVAGEIYRIEFYAQRADSSRYACNRLGALLTNNIPIQPGTGVIPFTPQLEFASVLADTANWILITMLYPASGGENYITIGLFRDDADASLSKTDFGVHNSGCINYDNSAYYFIDDVAVRPLNETVQILGDTVVCPNESTVLTADANVPFWWSTSDNPTDTFSLNTDITVTPVGSITYYLNGYTLIDSVTILIVNPPVVNLGDDSLLCEGDSVLLDATDPDAILYTWSTGDTTSSIMVNQTGEYWVTVDNLGCSVTDTIEFPGTLPNPPVYLGEDSLYCFFSYDTLTLDAGPALSWNWSPTGSSDRTLTILEPGIYTVNIIRENGCPAAGTMEVLHVCEPFVFIPNAFTPDGDGVNDIFKPFVNNVTNYSLRIVNRRGQTVFYSDNPEIGWDGTFENQDAPIDVYIYRLNYRGFDFEGSRVKGKELGQITLVR